MTFFEKVQTIGLPCVYSHYEQGREDIEIPYLAYHGNGQNTFEADDTFYWRENQYMVEYYFTEKDEEQEAHDNLPDTIQWSEHGETMQNIADALDDAKSYLEDASRSINEALNQ